MTSRKVRNLRRKLREAEAELRKATLPTLEQQEDLLLPEPGEELTRSEQVTLLKSSAEAWNAWYNPYSQKADLQDVDLQDVDLQDVYLKDANLMGADLRDANLQYANLWVAKLRGARLMGADLTGANLMGADLRDAYLRDADLRDADLRYALYSSLTRFPVGFDPETAGMLLNDH